MPVAHLDNFITFLQYLTDNQHRVVYIPVVQLSNGLSQSAYLSASAQTSAGKAKCLSFDPCTIANASCRTSFCRSACSGLMLPSAHSPHHSLTIVFGHIDFVSDDGECRLHTPFVVFFSQYRQLPQTDSFIASHPLILYVLQQHSSLGVRYLQ